MAKRTTYYVLPRKKGWAVKRQGACRASGIFRTKREAVRQARRFAENCISFVVMQDQGITEALTTDDYFRQAGFTVLLSPR